MIWCLLLFPAASCCCSFSSTLWLRYFWLNLFSFMLFCIEAIAHWLRAHVNGKHTQQLPGNTVRVNNYSTCYVDAITVIT